MTIDLKKNFAKFQSLTAKEIEQICKQSCIQTYLKTGEKPKLNFDGIPLLYDNVAGQTVFIKEGVYSECEEVHHGDGHGYPNNYVECLEDSINGSADWVPWGAIVKNTFDLKEVKQYKYIIVQNGDDNVSSNATRFKGHPTISFRCLSMLVLNNDTDEATDYQVAELIGTGRISLVDYVPDTYIQMNKEQRIQWKDYNDWKPGTGKRPNPPKVPVGFTAISTTFHRSCTALFYDKKTKKSYLLGQDEGTYFGCELFNNPKSIKEAFETLQPKEAIGVKGVQRQGEWFAIPVKDEKVPKIGDCLATFYHLVLPKEDEDSHDHEVKSDYNGSRIGKDGTVFVVNGKVVHDEHAPMNLVPAQWYMFKKNTAIRSVSVEGVD